VLALGKIGRKGRNGMRSMFVFFFSSRRRHTRLQGDWSSDVCSSDLAKNRSGDALSGSFQTTNDVVRTGVASRNSRVPGTPGRERSEERRVGKECRGRWGTAD